MHRLRIVERAKKRLSGYSQMSKEDEIGAWLEIVQCQSAYTDTRCTHVPSEATREEDCGIKTLIKTVSTALKDSDAGLRMRERIYQSSVLSTSNIESHVLEDVLHQIMVSLAKRSDDLWFTIQSMATIVDGYEVQLQRVLHSGCSALQRVYSEHAESEDAMGPHIAPRSAPVWLVTSNRSRSSFGATSWYIFRATCPRRGQKKALEFGVKVGVSVEAARHDCKDVLPGPELSIKSLTPALLLDLVARLSSRSCSY